MTRARARTALPVAPPRRPSRVSRFGPKRAPRPVPTPQEKTMSLPWKSAALTLALTLTTGCATTVSIRSMQPGVVPIGSARHLVLVGGEGRRSAREFVGQELTQQCRARGYFSFEDKSDMGLNVRVAGRQATIEGGKFALEAEQAGLRIDVLEWNAARDEEQ